MVLDVPLQVPVLAVPNNRSLLDSLDREISAHDYVVLDTNFFNFSFQVPNKREALPFGYLRNVCDEDGLAYLSRLVDEGSANFEFDSFISSQLNYFSSLMDLASSSPNVISTSPIEDELSRKSKYYFSIGKILERHQVISDKNVGNQAKVVSMFRVAGDLIQDYIGMHDVYQYGCCADDSIVDMAARLSGSVLVLTSDREIQSRIRVLGLSEI